MAVDVVDEIGAEQVAATCERAANKIITLLELGTAELVVLLCDDERIRELNRSWRQRDTATDVLSFAQEEGEELAVGQGPRILGDVVISVERAAVQAKAGSWSIEEETARLLLHGILHLLGYDHENGGDEEARMKAEESRLASMLVSAGIGCACEDLS
ncbi:MAG: putative rRNA maturation factor [Hyphomicrobiaceae bacterium]